MSIDAEHITKRFGNYEALRDVSLRIESGELQAGQRLPSFARMRAQGINQGTMERVYGLLEAEGALAALEGMPISSRFCSWVGLSGQRYVFSVYLASECPAFRDAVLLAVIRDMTGQRRVVSVRETGVFPEPVVEKAQRELRAFGPGLEFHLHLLATRWR